MSDMSSSESSRSWQSRSRRHSLAEQGFHSWDHRHRFGLCGAISLVLLPFTLLPLCWLGSPGSWKATSLTNEDHVKENDALTTPFPVHGGNAMETRFEILGCYPLQNGDFVNEPVLRDFTCMNPQAMGIPCRSGLPFYRMSMLKKRGQRAPVSWRACATYCYFKGFDISGVVLSIECRCGASPENDRIWKDTNVSRDRLELLMQPPWNLVPSNSSKCSILAARFTGKVPMTGVDFDRTTDDTDYVLSIVQGKRISPLQLDLEVTARLPKPVPLRGSAPNASGSNASPAVAGVQQAWLVGAPLGKRGASGAASLGSPDALDAGSAVKRSCYPGVCSAGLPWPIHTDFKGTGIPFAFSGTVSKATRKVFLGAIKELHSTTCIRFNEVSPFYNKTYKINVLGEDKGTCATKFLGYPAGGHWADSQINLGWCSSEHEKGQIMHELCHALGMAHEQTRPDRDSYVQINWETLRTDTERAQFEINQESYTGSSQVGHTPYDYESIMHYPHSENMKTRPIVNGWGAHDSQIGQRQQLSAGDVLQLRNMYRCDSDSIECIDNEEGLNTYGPYDTDAPLTCTIIRERGLCKGPYGQDMRYFCAKSCEACPQRSRTVAEVVGCQDQEGLEEVCKKYKDFCPGKVPGQEEYMYSKCRRTCYIVEFCGTSTTMEDLTTTTTVPSAQPKINLTLSLTFEIKGGGYNLRNGKDRAMLAGKLQERATHMFKTSTAVNIVPSSPASAEAMVKLACGCVFASGLPCGVTCRDLELRMLRFTLGGTEAINREMRTLGLAGVVVTSATIDGRWLQSLLLNKWTLLVLAMLGGCGCASVCALGCFYTWLHTEIKDGPSGIDTSYAELGDFRSVS